MRSHINQVYRHFAGERITQVFGNPRDYGITRDRSDQTDQKVQKVNLEQAINDFKTNMARKGGSGLLQKKITQILFPHSVTTPCPGGLLPSGRDRAPLSPLYSGY